MFSMALDRRTLWMALFAGVMLVFLVLLAQRYHTVFAQDGTIEYAENGTDPVSTYTATDPEGRPVYWSLLANDASVTPSDINPSTDSADAGHFSISADGVLSFEFPPDYEMPRGTELAVDADADALNTYKVVVVASDDAPGAAVVNGDDERKKAYEKVTVMVTDMDEPGMVTLSAQQPQVGQPLTATLTDDDASDDQVMAAKWKWEQTAAMNEPWAVILTATTLAYTPLGVEDKYLRVTATYTDEHGSDKTAQAVSANMVRAVPAANNANPVFPSDADTRSVDENSPPGTNVGKPVVANDAVGDVLTYTLENADTSPFDINPATGQITVGARTTLDTETTPSYMVTVTATDPWNMAVMQPVTITVKDVNEAPMMTGGATRVSKVEGTDLEVGASYTATDPESTESGDACVMASCTWSVSGTDAGDFEISKAAFGELTFKKAPNYEMPADSNGDNVYMVTVVVTDQDAKNKMTAMRDVTITITNVDEDGTVTLSSEQPKVGIPLTATLEDPDGVVADSVKWTWHSNNEGADPAIPMATSDTYTPKAIGMLSAKASYTDGHGANKVAMTEQDTNDVVENLANVAPKFPSSETVRKVAEGTPADRDINNTAAVDAAAAPVEAMDGADTLTYTLSGTDAASFSIGRADGQLKTKAKLDYETKNSYDRITVKATDSDGLSASIDVTIMVMDVDEEPMIDGDDVTKDYPEKGKAQVARFTATDPEKRMVYWSLADTPVTGVTPDDIADRGEFMINSDGVLSFKFSPDYEMPKGVDIDDNVDIDVQNTYKVVVAASDNAPGAATEDNPIMVAYKKVTVMVTNVEETETVTLSALQAQVGVALTATYNDLDNEMPSGATLMWKWYLGGSEIDGESSDTYEPTRSGSLRVEASYTKTDGTKKAVSKAFSVRAAPTTIPPVDPKFGEGADARSVDENSPPGTRVGDPVTAIDPGDKLTYTLENADTSPFDINPATGQITVGARTTLDTETTPSYMVTVTATDPWNMAVMQPVTITVKDVNEAPMMTGGATRVSKVEGTDLEVGASYTATDPESTESGDACVMASCTWSVSGTDAGDFEISKAAFGELTFKKAPNYEMPADSNGDNVYMVTVVVTDMGVDDKNKMTAERDVVITVTNVEEPGTVTLSSEQPKVGIPLTATLEDPDGVVADSVKWTWHSNNEGADPAIPMATSDTYTPKAIGMLSAKASYTDGHGANKVAMTEQDTNDVVENLANVAPKFPSSETVRKVAEGTPADRDINNTAAVDAAAAPVEAMDGADTLTYTLSGTDAASFGIDRATAQLTTKAKLDYETKNSYMVTVTATDPNGASASIDVTIMVMDVDEAPKIIVGGLAISGSASVSYAENGTDPVETYTLAGPNAATATWMRLGGDDAGDFRISSDGALTFARTPDYETPADADENNVYLVTLNARDSERNTATRDVVVTVTNVDDDEPVIGESLLDRYDADDNGTIEKEEARAAVTDYFTGAIDKEEAREVIKLYFASGSSS